jgi:Putative Actinobacterial Holin-X, holin superfamily III
MSLREERPVAAVVSDIVGNVQEIVRSEVRLAKAQIKNEAVEAASSATRLAYGTVLALYAIGLLLAAAVCLLSQFMPAWIAALVVCLIVSSIAVPLFVSGRRRWSYSRLSTEKPINVTKENVLWMNAQTK